MSTYEQHIKELDCIRSQVERLEREKTVGWKRLVRALNVLRWEIDSHFHESHPYEGKHRKTWDAWCKYEDEVAGYIATILNKYNI